MPRKPTATLFRLLSDYGMLLVLLALCLLFSAITVAEQHPTDVDAAERLADEIVARFGADARVLVAVRDNEEEAAYADALARRLTAAGATVVETVTGEPAAARQALRRAAEGGEGLDVVACNGYTAVWLEEMVADFPALAGTTLARPASYRWPNFLKADNLLNVTNQIAVIAIIAVGMTMVIITAGIDLSVGSLIALSAVVSAWFIREAAGGLEATAAGMTACCLAGIAVCALVGAFSGAMVTAFRIPPFIVTLAMMLVASGFAYIISDNQSIYRLPDSFTWLGRGADVLGIPNAVLLMLALYAAAHVIMTRTTLGRYVYAVGGNPEAARLSGVPVVRVKLFVYTLSGALAGLGGVVMASQLKSGSPTYGRMYELYVIAAVVVGGTSLAGGEGKMLGTLIGALIIAVIRNGMNLIDLPNNWQLVVMGGVILAAVLLDILKKRAWARLEARAGPERRASEPLYTDGQ